MAIPSTLDTLIELATGETDSAAQQLGRTLRFVTEAEQKLSLLMQYRDEYAARFQSNQATGLTAAGYRNFQSFIDKLDKAIGEQQLAVRDAQTRVNHDRSAWQASERKRASFDTLATRAIHAAQRKENKRDQQQCDEHAARQLQYKR